jgi:hypothetical protein
MRGISPNVQPRGDLPGQRIGNRDNCRQEVPNTQVKRFSVNYNARTYNTGAGLLQLCGQQIKIV